MSARKLLLAAWLAIVVGLTLAAAVSQTAHAGYLGDFRDFTYFRGKNGTNGVPSWLQFIDNELGGNYRSEGGSFSPSVGYVMPNRQATYAGFGGDTGQGGAVGMNALGYHGSDNQTRKQKMYELLERANRSGTDWEKMGSALIVHQMLGKKTPKSSGDALGDSARNITAYNAALWDELYERLVENPDVTMTLVPNYYIVGQMNTAGVLYYDGGAKVIDVVDYEIYGRGNQTGYEYAWVFQENGSTKYVLEINCANPMGNFPGFSAYDGQEYSLTPSISAPADGSAVKRGVRVTSNGSVTNDGPNDAGSKNWYMTRIHYSASVNPSKAARTSNSNGSDLCAEFPNNIGCSATTYSHAFPNGRTETGSVSYDVPADAIPGTKICFVVSVRNPTQDSNNPVWRHSAMRCVTIAEPDYGLEPRIESPHSDGSVVDPGAPFELTQWVDKTGVDPSEPTIWRLTMMVFSPGVSLSDGDKGSRTSGVEPCATFTSPSPTDCRPIAEQSRTDEVFTSDSTPFTPVYAGVVPTDLEVGAKLCFVSSVSRPQFASSPVWGHSSWWCLVIGKKPKMQVWGGDVRVGGEINTSTSVLNRTYGSWGEYAALSNGVNVGFASGAGLSHGHDDGNQCSWRSLTFANTVGGSCGPFGSYGFTLVSATLANQFPASSNTISGAVDLNSRAASPGRHEFFSPGSLTLSGTTIDAGKSIVVTSQGTVTIAGDIRYHNGEYSSVREIPQVVIHAPAVNIQGNVTQVDAWLLVLSHTTTAGVLDTCSDRLDIDGVPPENLTANFCNNPLTINGPVVADNILLRRTHGSNSGPSIEESERYKPAEIFNLRADAYLWGHQYGSRSSQVRTVHTKELPPRF